MNIAVVVKGSVSDMENAGVSVGVGEETPSMRPPSPAPLSDGHLGWHFEGASQLVAECYAVPRALGLLREIPSPRSLTSLDIIDRILLQVRARVGHKTLYDSPRPTPLRLPIPTARRLPAPVREEECVGGRLRARQGVRPRGLKASCRDGRLTESVYSKDPRIPVCKVYRTKTKISPASFCQVPRSTPALVDEHRGVRDAMQTCPQIEAPFFSRS